MIQGAQLQKKLHAVPLLNSAPVQRNAGQYLTDNRERATPLQQKQVAQRKEKSEMSNSSTSTDAVAQLSSADGEVVQREGWTKWGLGMLAGAGGYIAGGISGAAKGAVKGYYGKDGLWQGSRKGMKEGADEGWNDPASKTGEMLGAGIGAGLGAMAFGVGAVPLLGGAAVGALAGIAIKGSKKQTKTKIKHTADYVTIDGFGGNGVKTNHVVGKEMNATLVANDPVVGTGTDDNWTWMKWLKTRVGKKIVRGHLLNHDLGGFSMPQNLYPISDDANQRHSVGVEQNVKKLLRQQIDGKNEEPVNYHVKVVEATAHDPSQATFRCSYDVGGQSKKTVDVPSKLTDGTGQPHIGNALEDTKWAHKDRKGLEGDMKKSFEDYVQKGSIAVDESNISVLTEANEKVPKSRGGLSRELKDIVDMGKNYKKW